MICPVTLFGDGLDSEKKEIDGDIKPKKLFLPLAFALFHCLENLIEETQKNLNDRYKNQIESSINKTNDKIQSIKTRQDKIMSHPPRSWERITSWFSGEIGELEKKLSALRSEKQDLEKELNNKNKFHESELNKLSQYKKYKDILAIEIRFCSTSNEIKITQQGRDFTVDLPLE
ncbi:hypothetical protein V2H45_16435 [Tumidithrix elongata RA019]|uniref:Uncharacterized protein n=1 Tax=Tumidithrix elongata BACA0141 TaxID=2716417 RepID=A0AAW9PT41_9CYAN|nr:hypothetical protein [Tumidithrix elongata RA019]